MNLKNTAAILALATLLIFPSMTFGGIIGVPADLSLVEDSLTIKNHDYWKSIMGEIVNNGDVPVSVSSIYFVIFDTENDVIYAGEAGVSYISWCTNNDGLYLSGCILPNKTAVFESYIPDGLAEIDDLFLQASGWEWVSSEAIVSVELDGQVEIEEIGYESRLSGRVQNSGDIDLIGVSVVAIFRDGAGRVLDVAGNDIEGKRIGGFSDGICAGEFAEFDLSTSLGIADYSSYELKFTGFKYDGSVNRYAVAGIAHQAGYDGANWRSSLTITNRSGADGDLRLRFYRQNQDPIEQEAQITNSETLHWDDVVVSLFGVNEDTAGFVRIDSEIPVTVTARTANDTNDGSFGQLMPAITPSTTRDAAAGGVLTPVRSGDSFRTNVGFINPTDEVCSIRIEIVDLAGQLVKDLGNLNIPANSWVQFNDVVPHSVEVGSAVIHESYPCNIWPYASIVDRSTNDPTTISLDPEKTIHTGVPGARGLMRMNVWSD